MRSIRVIRSRTLVLPQEDIDTDQIIPARFLKTTGRGGLGRGAFADWRRLPDGRLDPGCPLERPEAEGCRVLVAGRNFGCGSSREHAVWALRDLGIEAVVSTRVADIFRSNALRNGLVPVEIPEADHRRLVSQPFAEIEIDIERLEVRGPSGERFGFALEPFARELLLQGVDELGWLLQYEPAITRYEENHRCEH